MNVFFIVFGVLERLMMSVGLIIFCLFYMLISFGLFVGVVCGDYFDLVCKMLFYDWVVVNGGVFEDVG